MQTDTITINGEELLVPKTHVIFKSLMLIKTKDNKTNVVYIHDKTQTEYYINVSYEKCVDLCNKGDIALITLLIEAKFPSIFILNTAQASKDQENLPQTKVPQSLLQ